MIQNHAGDQEQPHRHGIAYIHGPDEETRLHFKFLVAVRAVLMHFAKPVNIKQGVFKHVALSASWTLRLQNSS